jgi:hypothetical protein
MKYEPQPPAADRYHVSYCLALGGGGGGVRQRRAVYTRSLALSFSSQHESRSEDSVKVHGVSGYGLDLHGAGI